MRNLINPYLIVFFLLLAQFTVCQNEPEHYPNLKRTDELNNYEEASKSLKKLGYDYSPEQIKNLKKLEIDNPTDKMMSNIENLLNLEELHLGNLNSDLLTDKGLYYIKNLTNLKKLYIYVGLEMTDQSLKNLENLTKLEELHIYFGEITDAGLYYLRNLKNLKYLSFYNNYYITGSGLLFLKKLKKLEEFYFRGRYFRGVGLKYLPQFQNLKRLRFIQDSELRGAKFTHEDTKHFKNLVKLEELSCKYAGISLKDIKGLKRLTYLNLTKSQVYDGELQNILPLKKLKSLILYGNYKITNKSIPILLKFPKLKYLDIEKTSISKKGYKLLKKKLPHVNILYFEGESPADVNTY